MGAMRVFERMDISVPEDLSVAGYDGINLSQVVHPILTTYYQDTTEIGARSTKKLVDLIENPKTTISEQIMVNGKILEGHTVKTL